MSIWLSLVLTFFVVLPILVFVHELGHYITAKVSNIKVEEFGIGIPPRIWGFTKGETLYSINWIPLGGFCKMAGEEDPEVPRSLASKSIKTRIIVLSAGSVFMLLFPLFLLPAAYMTPMERPVEMVIVGIDEGPPPPPAANASLEVGDIILSVDGLEVHDLVEMNRVMKHRRGSWVELGLNRSGEVIEKTVYARTEEETPEGKGAMGVSINQTQQVIAYPPWEATALGITEYGSIMVLMKDAWGMLFSGEVPIQDAVVGIVGIAQITGEVASRGINPLVQLAVILSLMLGLVNLLPIPGLDGGRLIFVFIEGIRRGKRISAKKEGLVHLIGFFIVLGLALALIYNDIIRWMSGGSFLE